VSTYDPERYPAEGHETSHQARAIWPPLDQPSELVQRLRNLSWPEASEEARQRCWEQLSGQVEALSADARPQAAGTPDEQCSSGSRRGSDGQHDRRFGRHEFASRWGNSRHTGALGARVAATRGLSAARS
jgi:hypothetical protein